MMIFRLFLVVSRPPCIRHPEFAIGEKLDASGAAMPERTGAMRGLSGRVRQYRLFGSVLTPIPAGPFSFTTADVYAAPQHLVTAFSARGTRT